MALTLKVRLDIVDTGAGCWSTTIPTRCRPGAVPGSSARER